VFFVFLIAAIASFAASCIRWGPAHSGGFRFQGSAPLPKAAAALMVILGVMQVISGIGAFLYVAAILHAAESYGGNTTLAIPLLLFAGWGIYLGARLAARKTAAVCRSASFWYLPFALLLFAAWYFEFRNRDPYATKVLVAAIAFFAIFTIMVVPLLPGVSAKAASPDRDST
jgi:hypothetical protein